MNGIGKNSDVQSLWAEISMVKSLTVENVVHEFC